LRRPLEHPRLEHRALEQRRGLGGVGPGQEQPRGAGLHRRRADDAAVGDARAGAGHALVHRARGGGRDGVGVHVEPGEALPGDAIGGLARRVRRAYREHRVASRERRCERVHRLEPGRARALGGGGAAPLRDPQHAVAGARGRGGDARAHLAGMQDGDGAAAHVRVLLWKVACAATIPRAGAGDRSR